jgi:Na+/proline symporter
MSAGLILSIIALYFALIFGISYWTTRRTGSSNRAFFVGERKSPWYVVAIAMIGTSISGVTFISVPGMVGTAQCSYMQMVLGFVAGYFAVAYVLLPLYYRLGLCSIYGYLEQRYGSAGYRLGAIFFLISKFLGCGVRMYLTALVLQLVLFDGLGVPFGVNVALTMLIVWLYTFRGGVKTLVWADMVQTLSLVAAVVFCIYYVCQAMGLDGRGLWRAVTESPMSRVWWLEEVNDKRFFWKQFLAGAFTTIAMTGLDQDMMQKNLSCRSLRDAQKNVISYGFGFLPVNILFLSLGILLFQYAASVGLCDASGALQGLKSDELFPLLATGVNPATGVNYLPTVVGVLFVVGLIAAAFSSAGSAVTALTTSFTLDILKADRKYSDRELRRVRRRVHAVNAVVMGVLIYLFRAVGNHSVIDAVYVVAGYTYGPLLGLYFFGLYTRRRVRDRWIPAICVASPVVCYFLSTYSEVLFGGYQIGYELLLINGGLTAAGLYVASLRYPQPLSHAQD